MKTCEWCGRKYDDNSGVSSYGFLRVHEYCCQKCKNEAKAAETSKSSGSSSSDIDKSDNSGCLILTIIKWIIIILIAIFVLSVVLGK